jgi:hybrid polyketide synthase / nonribosomal peptide synthetase ACE1
MVTNAVLDAIGSRFSSYTITDISSEHFDSVKTLITPHLHGLIFKTLDIRVDAILQGFAEHSYDVIVASLALRATPTLHDTLRNFRKLLKTGGHMVIL